MKAERVQAREPAALAWAHTSLSRTCATLRGRRQALGISQESLALQLGVSGYLVRWWESGRRAPSLGMLAAWAAALGCGLVVVPVEGPPPPFDPAGQGDAPLQKRARPAGPGLLPDFSATGSAK